MLRSLTKLSVKAWEACKSDFFTYKRGFQLLKSVAVLSTPATRVANAPSENELAQSIFKRKYHSEIGKLVPFGILACMPMAVILLPASVKAFPQMLPSSMIQHINNPIVDEKLNENIVGLTDSINILSNSFMNQLKDDSHLCRTLLETLVDERNRLLIRGPYDPDEKLLELFNAHKPFSFMKSGRLLKAFRTHDDFSVIADSNDLMVMIDIELELINVLSTHSSSDDDEHTAIDDHKRITLAVENAIERLQRLNGKKKIGKGNSLSIWQSVLSENS